jgi:hypothetical protein
MNKTAPSVAVIGGGPAGLMAAEVLLQGGARVDLYDAMPSVGRKFLLAGKGGLNLTHSEPMPQFLSRYGMRSEQIAPLLKIFGPRELREWVHGLGIETFVGSSGRVFPTEMKAAPLLRAWVQRLRAAGAKFHMRHRWLGWTEGEAVRFASLEGERSVRADAVVMALGGGSWKRLGSDGEWVRHFADNGIPTAPLAPANCGFDIGWSEHFRSRFAGQQVKPVILHFTDGTGTTRQQRGEFVVTDNGIEGSLIYAFSAVLRDTIASTGSALIHLDLLPDREQEWIEAEISHPRGSRSLSSHLQSRLNLRGVKTGLLREALPADDFANPSRLARAIKALPLRLAAPRPLDEAISSAGGVRFEGLDGNLMVSSRPGVFCAGEMLDWEAPTGGYLLTACFASGRVAGQGALDWVSQEK